MKDIRKLGASILAGKFKDIPAIGDMEFSVVCLPSLQLFTDMTGTLVCWDNLYLLTVTASLSTATARVCTEIQILQVTKVR